MCQLERISAIGPNREFGTNWVSKRWIWTNKWFWDSLTNWVCKGMNWTNKLVNCQLKWVSAIGTNGSPTNWVRKLWNKGEPQKVEKPGCFQPYWAPVSPFEHQQFYFNWVMGSWLVTQFISSTLSHLTAKQSIIS